MAINNILKNKKGVFYLVLAIIFIGVIILVFMAYKEYSYVDKQQVVETRIMTINDFIRDIDTDSHRVIYISGFRSLIALEDYVANAGHYVNNSEELFRVAFYNGTVNGTKVDILINSSYQDYLQKLQVIASRIGLNIYINVTDITLYHVSPWSVNVIVTAFVNITDQRGLARWEFTRDYETDVSLINIRDPLYSVATYGKVPNTIRITNITDFVIGTNDTTGLKKHINNSYYIANPLAPSFIMRLEGDFNSSPHGIESLVNIQELIYQEVSYTNDRSIVDYILFSNKTNFYPRTCNVDEMPGWFTIDVNHTTYYEVDQLNYTSCS
jgi:hypothetical protein